MKIDNHTPLIRPGQASPQDPSAKVEKPSESGSKDAGPAAMTHLREGTADTSQDIDTARVAEIREAIREGRLEVRADRIADGLIASVRDLLDGSDS